MKPSSSRALPLLAASAALLLAAAGSPACLDSPGDDADGGAPEDGQVDPDGSDPPDAAPPDAATSCGAADLLDQAQCGIGRKCTLTDGTSAVGCAEAGFTAPYSGCEPEFPDSCEIGTLCSDAAGAYRCLPFCSQPGSFCEGGRCGADPVASGGGTSVYLCEPADGCDPVTEDPAQSGCETGQACYVVPVGAGLTFCEAAGSVAAGETCTGDYDCRQGYTCFGGGPKECRKVCDAGDDTDCPGSQDCGPLNENYGICF